MNKLYLSNLISHTYIAVLFMCEALAYEKHLLSIQSVKLQLSEGSLHSKDV